MGGKHCEGGTTSPKRGPGLSLQQITNAASALRPAPAKGAQREADEVPSSPEVIFLVGYEDNERVNMDEIISDPDVN